jgi:peptide-methionine (R)-S-oxide reductase
MSTYSIRLSRRALLSGGLATMAAASALAAAAKDQWAGSSWRSVTEAGWRARLPGPAFDVMRSEGTERPFSSSLNAEHRVGLFSCRGCGLPLFKSAWKFDSGTGWPSFYQAFPGALGTKADFAIGVPRTEYHCARCLGHQGHVFDDGPRPTGLRYCNNGVALNFAA